MLDPGGCGPFTINKAISIVNDGVGVVGVKPASGGNGITIAAGQNDFVNLRGLTFEGAGSGLNGILFSSGSKLVVSKSSIRNFSSSGLATSTSESADITILETLISNNASHGISLQPASGTQVRAVFAHVDAHQNGGDGILMNGPSSGSLVSSIYECMSATYFGSRYHLTGSTAFLAIARSAAMSNGGYGLNSESSAQLQISETNLNGNIGSSWTTNGGFSSYGDNYTNGVNVSGGTLTKN